MATFVLVHGAWHGGWCYKRVAAPGRARGLYADFDRPRRARSSAEPRDRSRHARSGHRWCHPLRGIVGRCAVRPRPDGAAMAIERGWLVLHESGTYVKFRSSRRRMRIYSLK